MSFDWLKRIVPDITNVQDTMSIQDIQNALVSKAGNISVKSFYNAVTDNKQRESFLSNNSLTIVQTQALSM